MSWNSSDIAIATVDKTGKVAGVKEGTATITAKSRECSATCSITVIPGNAVDLGLSVFWASNNIIEPNAHNYPHTIKYGNYFAWGEVERYGDVASIGLLFKENKKEYGYSFESYNFNGGKDNNYYKVTKTRPISGRELVLLTTRPS